MNQAIMRPAGDHKRPLQRKFNFSKEQLAAIKAPTSGRAYVYDTLTPHLVYCVTSTGHRSYHWQGRVNGRIVRTCLGTAEELTPSLAREAAARINHEKNEGVDPVEKKREAAKASEVARAAAETERAKAVTFGNLFEWYEANHAKPRKSSWKNDRSLYNTYLKPWADRVADAITQDDLQDIHAKLAAAKKPVTANRLLSMVSRMYNVARRNHALNFTNANPAEGIQRYTEQGRDEWLKTDAQIRAFNQAVDAEPSEVMRDFFRLSLYTGARRSNVLSMRWDEIDLAGKLWVIPAAKAKARENINVPLVLEVLDILMRRANGSEWVLPSHSQSGHLQEPKKAWADLIKRAKMPNLHLHDLRRSWASLMVRRGVNLLIIKAIMGHKQIKTTLGYAKADIEKMREASHLAADAIRQAIAPTPAKTAKAVKRGKCKGK